MNRIVSQLSKIANAISIGQWDFKWKLFWTKSNYRWRLVKYTNYTILKSLCQINFGEWSYCICMLNTRTCHETIWDYNINTFGLLGVNLKFFRWSANPTLCWIKIVDESACRKILSVRSKRKNVFSTRFLHMDCAQNEQKTQKMNFLYFQTCQKYYFRKFEMLSQQKMLIEEEPLDQFGTEISGPKCLVDEASVEWVITNSIWNGIYFNPSLHPP